MNRPKDTAGCDCLVIGGGLIGLLSARELAQAGMQVHVIDRGLAGRQASWAGGGILSPLYPWRESRGMAELMAYCQQQYPGLAESLRADTGIDPEWRRCGMLVFNVEDHEDALVWAKQNQASIHVLGEGQLKREDPQVNNGYSDTLLLPGIAQIRNPRLIAALKQDLRARGVCITENTEVQRIRLSQQKARGVDTSAGSISAGIIVVANGAWGSTLISDLDLKPVRGQMLCFQGPPDYIHHILLSGETYLIPRRDGQILVGSTMEAAGFDNRTTDAARQSLSCAAAKLLPGIEDFPLTGHWAGLRPATSTNIPYICAHPEMEGVYLNLGHHRNGILLAPGSARLLTDLILGRKPWLPTTAFGYPAGTTAAV